MMINVVQSVKSLSCVWFFATPWTLQSMEFSSNYEKEVTHF